MRRASRPCLPDQKRKSLHDFALTIAPALYTAYYRGKEELENFINLAMVYWLRVWPEEMEMVESNNVKALKVAQQDWRKRVQEIRQLLKFELNYKAWEYETEDYNRNNDPFASISWRRAMEQLLEEDTEWKSYPQAL
ncbi:hypothetical protein E1B28_010680 [Marasmius oreades]|uniref:Uncharacterized protein n=1 Tax=Marasmius oreades TaxID=181124 RepID=A0A9P7RXJ8_9AGAR|nr:uncharacterized protein E1B28_010680 [Marasmius oreades]KAG7091659.1 hypothetical protein E1B28_010680 [Marasmius oreades]